MAPLPRSRRARAARRGPGRAAVVVLALGAALSVPAARAQTPAVRLSDPTNHGGIVVAGSPDVLIEGRAAARAGDSVLCPLVCGTGAPHLGGPIGVVGASSSVLINGLPSARVGTVVPEGCLPSVFLLGSPTVSIGD